MAQELKGQDLAQCGLKDTVLAKDSASSVKSSAYTLPHVKRFEYSSPLVPVLQASKERLYNLSDIVQLLKDGASQAVVVRAFIPNT